MNKLSIVKRNFHGKLHELRAQGIVPGVIYGPTIKSSIVKTSQAELKRATDKIGEVYSVRLNDLPLYVRLEEVQKDPRTGQFVHFSLVQLPRGVENKIEVPINLKGTPVGSKHGGMMVVLRDRVSISGLIKNIPIEMSADISHFDIGDKITVGDLKTEPGVKIQEDPEEVIAICQPPTKISEEKADESLTDLSTPLTVDMM